MSTKGKDQARNLAFRARFDAFVVGDADGDVHGRLPRKGGVQEMHFSGLRPTHANIATAPDGHLDNTMIELLFLRRGACLRKCEKTLYVVLGTLRYMSRVCCHNLIHPDDVCIDTLRILHYEGEENCRWSTPTGRARARCVVAIGWLDSGAMHIKGRTSPTSN